VGLLDLVRPAWRYSEWRVREAAVKKLDDQAVLARIVVEDEDSGVSLEAVKKLDYRLKTG